MQVDLHGFRRDERDALDKLKAGFQQFILGHDLVHQADAQSLLRVDVIAGERATKVILKAGEGDPDEIGVVAMANKGPNTNTSQFFVMLRDNTSLPKNYTIFGKVVKGMEIVDKIGVAEAEGNGQPKADIVVKKVRVANAAAPEKK